MLITFYGVRGSPPSPSDANRRYGGNTATVVLERPGVDPIVFDLGTGLRMWGQTLPAGEPWRSTAHVTQNHWDHVQGLPCFSPVLIAKSDLDVYAPHHADVPLAQVFGD